MDLVYDRKNRRLVYFQEKATSHFWDRLWKDGKLKKSIESGRNDLFVSTITKIFLRPGKNSRILEGGCGKGSYVYSLQTRGFDVFGIDYAEETVKRVNVAVPQLQISVGDVRKLPFPNGYFDGYWSLGVIEHFYEGYSPITDEMSRVIKPGGYLFLTFPFMSPLRKVKARFGQYREFDDRRNNYDDFYQFALDAGSVIRHLRKKGFSLVLKKALDGTGGLKREIKSSILRKMILSIENWDGKIGKLAKMVIGLALAPISGHSVLLVLRKKKL